MFNFPQFFHPLLYVSPILPFYSTKNTQKQARIQAEQKKLEKFMQFCTTFEEKQVSKYGIIAVLVALHCI